MQHEHDNMQDFKGTNGPLDVVPTGIQGRIAVRDETDTTVCEVWAADNEFCGPADAHLFAAANQLLNVAFHALDGLDCGRSCDPDGNTNDDGNLYCYRCLVLSAIRAALNDPKWTPTGD